MFKKMFIYFLYYEDEVIYVGSTKDFKKRMNKHKSYLKNGCKYKLYEFMRENNILFENLKAYKFETDLQTKFELKYLEGIYIRLFKPICNENIAGRSKKEWREDNGEYLQEYRKKNKEQRNEKNREYNKKNKEIINKKNRERDRQKNTINCIRYLFK